MTRRRKWLLAVAAVLTGALVVGNVMLFNALPKPKRLQDPLTLEYGTGDPQFVRTLRAVLQQPIVAGNRIDLLIDGEEIYAAKLDAIAEAEYSITYETYEFWGEKSAGELADALIAAAERGVRVHALIDFVGSVLASGDKFTRMEEAGIEVIRWREPSWYHISRFNHRTHRKLLMVDGRVGFTGGANNADNWLKESDNTPYRDNHFRLQGPIVAQMQAAFYETWLDAKGEMLHGDAYFPELEEAGELHAQVINSAPREGRHRIRKLFLYALAAAEEHVTICTAYFYPDVDFLDALASAAERGVQIRILVPGDSIDQGYLRHASVNRWRPMLEAGVELYEYQPAMMHSKLMSIDDRWASLGSSNLDNRSFRFNDEANINVYDAGFARQIRELIEGDLKNAERYTLEQWQERAWHKRLIGWVSAIIGIYL